MFFAGLTSGYIVRRDTGNWLKFNLPYTFWISSALILASSFTMNLAFQSVKKGNIRSLLSGLPLTIILGLLFGVCQYASWHYLIMEQIFPMGSMSSASGSYLFVISGLHLAHILGGLVALAIIYFKARRGKYSSSNYFGIKLGAIYWHFLDALWIYLFVFLLIVR
jgi:cytochrome c oxidase subunit 3